MLCRKKCQQAHVYRYARVPSHGARAPTRQSPHFLAGKGLTAVRNVAQAGKDAVRSVLIAIGIDEACRLRPRAVYDGVTFKVTAGVGVVAGSSRIYSSGAWA